MSVFPDSVFEFGEWLKAHPCVKRVKLPDAVFEDYMAQVSMDLRVTGPPEPMQPVLTWRLKQAMIPAFAWHSRDALFPPSFWRRA